MYMYSSCVCVCVCVCVRVYIYIYVGLPGDRLCGNVHTLGDTHTWTHTHLGTHTHTHTHLEIASVEMCEQSHPQEGIKALRVECQRLLIELLRVLPGVSNVMLKGGIGSSHDCRAWVQAHNVLVQPLHLVCCVWGVTRVA